ncbi:hypothetical protein BD626DRAFT_551280 [Schizophyllum amplum]|uniref:Uncharacterized protein n=1 Tax=Schizophyllum amplum TaxID=97359 RepID=A0A550BWI7_9AGAR|nr:hypothetical protein BD626DRAFT_551280 [Auriculariopsis ampla]
MRRNAHFASASVSAAFDSWEPDAHAYYEDVMKRLFAWKPSLKHERNFARSIWACMTVNFGPRTLAVPHRDFANICFGMCSVTALGRFSPDRGGHIVLRELKMVVRFPAGSTILIPSAIVTHYNTSIGEHETRYSITQYTAGAIFRFVEHGCQLDAEYYKGMSRKELRAAHLANAAQADKGRGMLSKLPVLRQKAAAVASGLHGTDAGM